jgi:hypothetical protein
MLVKLHFFFKIELSPAFWQGGQIVPFFVVNTLAPLSQVEYRHLVPYIPLKMIFGMHFLRGNEGSQKINADSTAHLTARFHLTRKKWGYFKRRSWKPRSRSKLCHKVGLERGLPKPTEAHREQKKKKKIGLPMPPEASRGIPRAAEHAKTHGFHAFS